MRGDLCVLCVRETEREPEKGSQERQRERKRLDICTVFVAQFFLSPRTALGLSGHDWNIRLFKLMSIIIACKPE